MSTMPTWSADKYSCHDQRVHLVCCSCTSMESGTLSKVSRGLSDLHLRGDPHSLNPELPVLHKLYENYTLAGKNMSRLLDAVFKNYDKRIRPFYEGKKSYFTQDPL